MLSRETPIAALIAFPGRMMPSRLEAERGVHAAECLLVMKPLACWAT